MIFRKKELVLFATIIIAIAIGVVGVKFNYGYLHINAGVEAYNVTVGKQEFECPNSESFSCELKLAPKNYSVIIKKEGYNDFETKTEISRNQTVKIDYAPILKPTFKPYSQTVKPLFDAKLITANGQTKYTVNDQVITTFLSPLSSAAVAVVSPDGFVGIVYEPKNLPELYLIDITQKSKELIVLNIDFLPTQIGLLGKTTLLIQNSETVVSYDLVLNTQTNFPIVSVNHIACASNTECLFISPFDIDTEINNVDSDLNLFAEIVTEKGFDIFTTQDLEYKLYLLNQETQQISFIENLPGFILNPETLILAPNSDNTQINRYIKSESDKFYQIIF